MEKKFYVTPNIQVVELQTLNMLAASGPDSGVDSDGNKGGMKPTGSGDAGQAYSASRQYFDAWTDDDEYE